MVGKTPQVREIVYNVLDDNGDRTVVAKGATTVDVGDTKELFTRTTALESLTSDNVSNISDIQSEQTALRNFLGGAVLDQSFEISAITFCCRQTRSGVLPQESSSQAMPCV